MRSALRAFAAGLLVLLGASPAAAQLPADGPPGPYVIDLRGATLGVPQASTYHPEIPASTNVPARVFGLQLGGHVYPFRWGPARIGLGLEWTSMRGTSTTPPGTTGGDDEETGATTFPDVTVSARVISPQVSLNFGRERGWSYLALGAGRMRVRSEATGGGEGFESAAASTSVTDINVGGGARWFLSDHIGIGFDLRLHRLPGSMLFGAAAGFSVK